MNESKQQGQTLVLMLAFTLVLAIALIYLFNTSQLLAERTQAKVLADHASYNTAVKQAQLLNANAYMNKAKIANQLATAQAVSVASWAEHFQPIPEHTQWINLIPVYGNTIYSGLVTATNSLGQASEASAPFIIANNVATKSVSEQQNLLNNTSIIEIRKIPTKTLQNSSIGTDFKAEALPLSSHFSVNDPFNGNFIKQYQGNSSDPYEGRQRLKDVVLASRDPFTRERRVDSQWNLPGWIRTWNKKGFELHRRGGTEVSNDLNQWKGVDTMSLHYEKLKIKWTGLSWKHREDQIGYGSALVRNDGGDNDRGNLAGYSNVLKNRDASNRSHQFTPSWDARSNNRIGWGETGIPRFWDLDPKFLAQDEPTLPLSIRITKGSDLLDTTSGAAEFKVGRELDIVSNDNISAISSAEVYFERPLQDRRGSSTFLNNGKFEKASLLNPYWQVRLINNSPEAIAEGRTR
ncbi:hypothetical protein [Psychrobacter lutiphocae]|uniref:hypothetical protein n=1 Tax=Psychrobacter lutiphocae TaxID=540500 RepID=UPI00036B4CBC|nr:hypothetical protein [Psychrobacter lutiphocae]